MDEAVPLPRPAEPPDGHDLLISAGILAAEAALLGLVLLAKMPWAVWLPLHLALVAWLARTSWRGHTGNRDISARALTLLTVLVGGPFGALAQLGALLLWRWQRTRQELLAAWYDRIALAGDIDSVTRLADSVAMGRAVGTSESPPRPFSEVMHSGTLSDRQAALGLIARRFSPAYAPALEAALITGEPMVRVQAAAVATRVRAGLKTDIRAALAEAETLPKAGGAPCVPLIGRLRELLSTGMIEDDDRAAADVQIARLAEGAASGPPPSDPLARGQLETELLRLGRFAAFRELRATAEQADEGTPGAGHGR